MSEKEISVLWQSPPKILSLQRKHVHIWQAVLPMSKERICDYWSCLSEDEKQRANSFYFAQLRDNYICARGTLRHILAKYTSMEPQQIQFEYSRYGKPSMLPNNNKVAIHFNVSHSKNCVLYALSMDAPIGVDVEFHQSIDFPSLAENFFSSFEYEQFIAAHESDKEKLFFKIWTCKEAFTKAVGKGLAFPLKEFDVKIEKSKAIVQNIQIKFASSQPWILDIFNPSINYSAAYVINALVDHKYFWLWE